MESSRSAAQETFLETMQRLAEIVPGANLDEPMTLHAVTPYKQVLETTFGREVCLFNTSGFLPRAYNHSCGLLLFTASIIGQWYVFDTASQS